MILIYLLVVLICAGWAAIVASNKYSNLDPADRRAVISGLVVIAFLCPPVAVIAAYLAKPVSTVG